MKKLSLLILTLLVFSIPLIFAFKKPDDGKCYELRVYYAPPGKIEDLHRRFRENTTRLFEKHGMTNIGYWVPLENLDNKIIYILAYPSREAREQSWKNFFEDPEWKKVASLSEANGKLVTKVESTFLKTVDFSPVVKSDSTDTTRVFELRTYKTHPGKFENLLARFRNHTAKLFEKHGMTNIGYWVPVDKEKGADNTLIYILAHKSKEAGEASFKSFGNDPDWIKAKTKSEAKGPVVEKLESIYMAPTDYSPIK